MNTSSSPFMSSMSSTAVPLDSAFLKIALLLLTGMSTHYSLTPPHSAAPKTILPNKTLFERGILWVTWCTKTLVWMMTVSDALATCLAAYHPSTSFMCPHAPSFSRVDALGVPVSPLPNPLLTPSPLLITGAVAAISANLLRQWCFRELGALFTFEVTIHPDHTLITTGPYSFVRHPSYTGVFLTLLGSTAVGIAPGAWLRECWFSFACTSRTTALWTSPMAASDTQTILGAFALPSFGQLIIFSLVAFWFAKLCLVFKSTAKRVYVEDAELQKVFGQTWEEYAQRVPYRLVPGIF